MMAFHQPTRRPSQLRANRPLQEEERDVPQLHVEDPAATDPSHSWVLFEPADDTATTSYLSEQDESLTTPGRSRLSDIGSLNTFVHSARDTESRHSGVHSSAVDEESVEDDAELDSLDSHLPEFRTVPSLYTQSAGAAAAQSAPVLPAHDGLGSFRLDGPEVQEQIYAFERFNPKRVRRRRESLDLAQLEMEVEGEQESHKMQRIEAWRLEQSRILLEEISRETRRRRQSMASIKSTLTVEDRTAEDTASLSAMGNEDDADSMDWHYESADAAKDNERGLFASITRKVLNDLGIDERLLSILLGEQFLFDDDLSTTPKTGADLSSTPTQETNDSSWQVRALDRVAKELGLMVNQLSHHHPGAFSTYTRMQPMPIPYAGLPAIPESGADMPMAPKVQEVSTKMPEFQPTIVQHARPIDIPTSRPAQAEPPVLLNRDESTPLPTSFTQEEWEQDLDVNLVFRYLRSRFSSRSNPSAAFTTGTSHLATSSTPDTAAKAARVRQHHPLVSRTRPVERRAFKATAPSSPAAMRHASSCASHSTRRSARRSSVSSRHYWDIGGSIGTGSVIASVGPMGSWGEV